MHIRHLALIAALAACGAYAAEHHHQHQHGVGLLDVEVENAEIEIELDVPMDSAVGFEHLPRNTSEKAALAKAEAVLRDAAALFKPTPAAGCTLVSAKVELPDGDDKHEDIEGEYVFRCADPAALKGVETTLFKHFKQLYRLEAEYSGPMGRGTARITPKQPALTW
jgi:hypothetical protein